MRKSLTYLVIGCILLFGVGASFGFWAVTNSNDPDEDIVSGVGVIVFLNFEGGFFGIIADDGSHYDPINLPDGFKINGLIVEFLAKILHDMGSFHMWGEIVELVYVNSLS